ncbi:hypothetical protein CEXT_552541 [Caerostris extrusa]|uniref:Uncharacterized protein n=1 Tax=Caerostris extrusa TaxID=172846 RepID=A0AAV4YB42_CAEEX|nr:hypothetical protein CEXT_552541 [Caerostris extrusa]
MIEFPAQRKSEPSFIPDLIMGLALKTENALLAMLYQTSRWLQDLEDEVLQTGPVVVAFFDPTNAELADMHLTCGPAEYQDKLHSACTRNNIR